MIILIIGMDMLLSGISKHVIKLLNEKEQKSGRPMSATWLFSEAAKLETGNKAGTFRFVVLNFCLLDHVDSNSKLCYPPTLEALHYPSQFIQFFILVSPTLNELPGILYINLWICTNVFVSLYRLYTIQIQYICKLSTHKTVIFIQISAWSDF